MSLLPELGHLYHDSAISNSAVILDSKEFLRTREINAREQRHLDSLSKYLTRAKSAGERVRNHEKWCVEQRLRSLQIKTPTLEKGLRRETKRQQDLRDRFGVLGNNLSPFSGTNMSEASGARVRRSWARHPQTSSVKSIQIYPEFSQVRGSQIARAQRSNGPPLFASAFKIYPEYRPQRLSKKETQKKFLWKKPPSSIRPSFPEGTNFVKRAEQVVKSLHKLYSRLLEREEIQWGAGLNELLDSDSKELLQRARMVLGQSAIDDLMMAAHDPYSLRRRDGEVIRGVPASLSSHDSNRPVTNDGGAPLGDTVRTSVSTPKDLDVEATGEKMTVEFVDEIRPVPRQNNPQFSKVGELINLSSDRRDKRRMKESNVRVSSWMNTSSADRSRADCPRNSRPNMENTWSEITPYKALWQQNSGDRAASKEPKKRALVTLAGKHRKTLLYR